MIQFRASMTAAGVVAGTFFAVFALFAIPSAMSGAWTAAIWFLLIGAVFAGLYLLNSTLYRLNVYPDKIEGVRSLFVRHITTIEGHKLEGAEIREGLLGRALGYGSVAISGTGGKGIKTPPVNKPQAVVDTVRRVNRQPVQMPLTPPPWPTSTVAPQGSGNPPDGMVPMPWQTTAGDSQQQTSGPPPQVAEALRRLAHLYAIGHLTDEEYAQQRSQILGQAH